MSKTLKLLPIFVLSLLLFALSISPVLADDIFWSTPEQINTSNNNAITPVFTTDSQGYLHAAWMELNKSGTGSEFWDGLNPGIFYSYWNGDAWATPVKVSQNTDWAGFPAIASTSDGKIHVFYEDDSPDASIGQVLYRNTADNGQNWSTPVVISQGASEIWSWAPQVAVGPTDNLHVIFNDESSTSLDFYYTKWDGNQWSTPVKISTTDAVQHAMIAVDSSDTPHVLLQDVWIRGLYYTYFTGTDWSTSVKISDDGMYPRIISDLNDQLHGVWTAPNPGTGKAKVEYSTYVAGSWTSPTLITPASDFSYWGMPYLGLTYDSDNNVYVGWGERLDNGTVDVSYKKWNGSTWSNPVFMRNVEDLETAFVYKDKWDNQHMSWSEYNSAADEWQFWYAAIPANVQSYNPASDFSMTLNITEDTLEIPAGALAESKTISAQIGPLPASADPGYTTLPRSYTYRPHGTTFAAGKEATAVIGYTDEEVIGTDEANMVVYIWDSSTNSWSATFDTSVNTGKNEATVTLPHFSLFGIMLKKVTVTWLDPLTVDKTFKLGSTIPIKFKLAYADGSSLDPGKDVSLEIYSPVESLVDTFEMDKGVESLRYDSETGQFIANFKTKNLVVGVYTIEVKLAGNPVGTTTISLSSKE